MAPDIMIGNDEEGSRFGAGLRLVMSICDVVDRRDTFSNARSSVDSKRMGY